MLLPLDPLFGKKFSHQQFPFIYGTPEMLSQTSSTHWVLLFQLSKNQEQVQMTEFHSWHVKCVNVFYLSARKVPYFCWYSIQFPLSCPIWLHQKLNFKDLGLQTTEEPSNVNEFQSWPAKGTLEATASGWNVQYPLTKPLRLPVMLTDFFSCCLDINSAY